MKESPFFDRYLELLLKWNKAYNLTAITDRQAVQIKHFEDSLAPLPFLPTPCRLLDLGCGAGFPGIPLKIGRPDLEVVLLDSNHKKVAFCATAIRELGLTDIKAIQGRAEDPKVVQSLGVFDLVITRATRSLEEFLVLGEPFVKKGGKIIAMKGKNWKKEYKNCQNWVLKEVFDYKLSKNSGERSLLIFSREP